MSSNLLLELLELAGKQGAGLWKGAGCEKEGEEFHAALARAEGPDFRVRDMEFCGGETIPCHQGMGLAVQIRKGLETHHLNVLQPALTRLYQEFRFNVIAALEAIRALGSEAHDHGPHEAGHLLVIHHEGVGRYIEDEAF
jgi:hypothetical protein